MRAPRIARCLVGVLAALAAPVVAGCHGAGARARPPRAVRVEVVTASTQASTWRYSGTILARTQVDLAFKTSGYVQMVAGPGGEATRRADRGRNPKGGRLLQAGDPVTRDMVLAALRKEDFKQRFSELSGMSAEASAGYRKAKQDYDRATQLFRENVISRADYDAARSRFESFAGASSAAAARVGQAGLALGDTQLRSPLDGIILDRRVEVGALVAPGAPVFTVADTSTMKVVFDVPDSLQRTLTLGQPVTVTTDAVNDRVFSAVITRIAAQAESTSRVFEVESSLDNSERALKVGMVASIQLGSQREGPSLQIPLSAVVRAPDQPAGFAVFVIDPSPPGGARLRIVELGTLVGTRVVVEKGLAVADRVIVQGATLLQDGDAVSIVPGSTQSAPFSMTGAGRAPTPSAAAGPGR